jgi:hypothetical protein
MIGNKRRRESSGDIRRVSVLVVMLVLAACAAETPGDRSVSDSPEIDAESVGETAPEPFAGEGDVAVAGSTLPPPATDRSTGDLDPRHVSPGTADEEGEAGSESLLSDAAPISYERPESPSPPAALDPMIDSAASSEVSLYSGPPLREPSESAATTPASIETTTAVGGRAAASQDGADVQATEGSDETAAAEQTESRKRRRRGDRTTTTGEEESDSSAQRSRRTRQRKPSPDDPEERGAPVVGMVVDSSEFEVGDRVAIRIEVAGAVDVGSVPFHVLYDPAVLQFEWGEEGPFLGGDGRQTAFFAAPTSQGDEVVIGLSRLGRGNGIVGAGELCVLYFTAVGPGDAGLGFSRAKVRDSNNRIVPSSFDPVAMSVR